MIRGSIVAIVTPMAEDGSVDFPALERLVEWHIAEGTDGIVAVGTTGESATLDVDEHVAVIRGVVKAARKRVPVIAGTGANSTAEAIELTAEGKAAGADACLLVTPYYNKPPQEGLYRHYKAIAEFTQKMKDANYPALFEKAAKEFNVPPDVLKGVAFAETRWSHHQWPPGETVSPENGMPRAYGIMALMDDDHFGHSLIAGAALIAVPIGTGRREVR